MPGSAVDEPPVCDMAAPPKAHSNAVDRIATAEGVIRLDLTTCSPNPDINAVPVRTPTYPTRRSKKHHWTCPMYLANFLVGPF